MGNYVVGNGVYPDKAAYERIQKLLSEMAQGDVSVEESIPLIDFSMEDNSERNALDSRRLGAKVESSYPFPSHKLPPAKIKEPNRWRRGR